MNYRDSLLASINGQEMSPVPTDVTDNLICPKLKAGLCEHFGLKEDNYEGLLQVLHAGARWAKPVYVGPQLEEAPGHPSCVFPAKKVTRNIWGGWTGLGTYSDEFERPLRFISSVADIESYCWPEADQFDYQRVTVSDPERDDNWAIVSWAEMHRDYARIVGGFEPIFCRIMDLCGMEAGLLLLTDERLASALVTQIAAFLEEYYGGIAENGKGYIDIVAFGDDFAGQNGMLLSPESWRKLFLPVWRRLFDTAHRFGMKAMLHSCGSIRPILGDLIDAGLDILQVVQITSRDMDAVELKRQFGRDLAFYGAIDTQYTLPYGTEEEVRREVRRVIDILGRGGRYVCATSHILQDDVPVQNVVAMYDEAQVVSLNAVESSPSSYRECKHR